MHVPLDLASQRACGRIETVRRLQIHPELRRHGKMARESQRGNTLFSFLTDEKPHQYLVGIDTVIVNGVVTVRTGKHTDAHAGRALFGPGYLK